ncbi:hypothetical protein BJY04DRAFT_126844 [Aspergillus karnatakaensis]|uniref:uncharacterized protein n=1 Tax=Aspergillus karnatakaensis TaxID=1810916 RepID=UPI003CCCD034
MKTIQVLSSLLAVSAQAIAQESTATGPITSAPVPEPTSPSTAGIIRPSSGETVTVGKPYTISWSDPPPPAGPLAIELFGDVSLLYSLAPESTGCDGWLINTECDKFNVSIPSGSTSFVWNLSKPYDYWRLLSDEEPYRLGLYVDNLEYAVLPETGAPWYWTVDFTIASESTTTTTTTRSTRTTETTTSTSTSTESAEETSEAEETDGPTGSTDSEDPAPTDGAVSLFYGGIGTWSTVGLIAVVLALLL